MDCAVSLVRDDAIGANCTKPQSFFGEGSSGEKPAEIRLKSCFSSSGSSLVAESMGPELVTLHWRTHRAALLRKCLFLTYGDTREAEDLLSDAYLRGLEAAHASKLDVESPVGWWLTIIANLARDRRRRARHRLFRDTPREVVEEIADAGPGLEQVAEARQHLERTLDRVRLLTQGQRSALAGRGAGEDYQELARNLGIKPANVRKLVQTARAALR